VIGDTSDNGNVCRWWLTKVETIASQRSADHTSGLGRSERTETTIYRSIKPFFAARRSGRRLGIN
jgi:hypothetical protein